VYTAEKSGVVHAAEPTSTAFIQALAVVPSSVKESIVHVFAATTVGSVIDVVRAAESKQYPYTLPDGLITIFPSTISELRPLTRPQTCIVETGIEVIYTHMFMVLWRTAISTEEMM
jgi:hypothetical protein